MAYPLNPIVQRVIPSPISESQGWIAGRAFPADKPLLNIAQAVPGYAPAEALTAHLAEQVKRPETSVYTAIHGLPELRAALAAEMRDAYGGAIAPEQVIIVAGCNQGFCAAVLALAQAGDEVILPLPYYFNHQMWLEMLGIRPLHLPFSADAIPDPAAAARLITPRTRAIALVTPNNPTGAVYPPAVLDEFYRLARAHGIALVVDETYKDFRDGDGPAHALFRYPDWDATFVQLYSFSKAYSLTGYRVGSVIGNAALVAEIAKIQDCVAICAPRIGQDAALYGLRHLAAWRHEKAQLMQERRETLKAVFRRNDMRYQLLCLGAYFAYVRHPFQGESALSVARRLADEHNILCLPGSTFGPGQEPYLRFAFANLDSAQIPELARRLLESQPQP